MKKNQFALAIRSLSLASLAALGATSTAVAAGKSDLVNGIVDRGSRSATSSSSAPQGYTTIEDIADEGTGAGNISRGKKSAAPKPPKTR